MRSQEVRKARRAGMAQRVGSEKAEPEKRFRGRKRGRRVSKQQAAAAAARGLRLNSEELSLDRRAGEQWEDLLGWKNQEYKKSGEWEDDG